MAKRGRPKKKDEERKRHQYRLRLDDEGWNELQKIKESDRNISDVLRDAIHMAYLAENDPAKYVTKYEETPRKHHFDIRLNDKEWDELQYLKNVKEINITWHIRHELHMAYLAYLLPMNNPISTANRKREIDYYERRNN